MNKIPYGYCHCGCGQKTNIYKGKPSKYLIGHINVMRAKPITERFWSKVDKSGGDDACWAWTASCSSGGYGKLYYKGKVVDAHRIAWELTNGDIPPGICICHTCDNRLCVNPKHLFLGTFADNMADMHKKGRGGDFKGERQHKHKLTNENVLFIRHAHELGEYEPCELAKQFGVSKTTISRVVQRKTWAHLT